MPKHREGRTLRTLRQAMGIAERDWEYIYFIQGGERVKIGRSRDVDARIPELQTGANERLVFLAAVHGDRHLEARLHSTFADQREHGEWFRHEGQLRTLIEEMMATDRSDLATKVLLAFLNVPEKSRNLEISHAIQ